MEQMDLFLEVVDDSVAVDSDNQREVSKQSISNVIAHCVTRSTPIVGSDVPIFAVDGISILLRFKGIRWLDTTR